MTVLGLFEVSSILCLGLEDICYLSVITALLFFFFAIDVLRCKGEECEHQIRPLMVLHVPVLLMTPVNANVIGNLELVTSFVNIWFVIM